MDTFLSVSGANFDLPKFLWPRTVIFKPGCSLELAGEPTITGPASRTN